MSNNTDKYNNDAHFTYKDYKQKVMKAPNRDLVVFVSVFIIGVLMLLGFAKILSPNVDVGISAPEDEFAYEDDEAGSSVIDERLKNIQMEDAASSGNDEMFSPELDEKVVLPKQVKKTVGEMEAEMQNQKNQQQKAIEPEKEKIDQKKAENNSSNQSNTQSAQNKPASAEVKPVAPTVNAKVVVGYYATEKQAEVAKSILQDAGLNITPIVKDMNGYFTLQVGSYSSKDKAQQSANNLLKSNFPARVIIE